MIITEREEEKSKRRLDGRNIIKCNETINIKISKIWCNAANEAWHSKAKKMLTQKIEKRKQMKDKTKIQKYDKQN